MARSNYQSNKRKKELARKKKKELKRQAKMDKKSDQSQAIDTHVSEGADNEQAPQ